ncbi:MAG: glycosyltransferase family 2 protein [Acidimicrobiia bacterium]|nr:glycosyltransferase family 2 protein [Acidimicrobiia bacterium]
MAEGPAVSVVVPTHQRRPLLARLVRALEQQTDAPPFEVVIVDDASTDGTSDELDRLRAASAVPVIGVRLEENRGPATARNAGWRRAKAPIIAFTDDDCAPQPGWLAALARALDDADVVQGRTVPDPEQLAHRNVFSHTVLNEDEWGFYETCNMGYRRRVLEGLGGFDERFRYPFGEDTDLAWRAKAAGARVAFEREALVHHDVRRQSYFESLRDLRRREGVVRAIKRNPEMRSLCHYGIFWRPAHPSAFWAGVGLATAAIGHRTRWPLLAGGALCLPYVRYRTHTYPTGLARNRPVTVPMQLASDLVEMAVLAAASVRYRTVVL